jgi:hypothetical protein
MAQYRSHVAMVPLPGPAERAVSFFRQWTVPRPLRPPHRETVQSFSMQDHAKKIPIKLGNLDARGPHRANG